MLLPLLIQFHVGVPAPPLLDAISAILCAAYLVPVHLKCSWCQFLLWVWWRSGGMTTSTIPSGFASAAVSAALPADAISRGGTGSASFRCCFSNLCAACRVPLHLDCSWHRFLLWVRAGS